MELISSPGGTLTNIANFCKNRMWLELRQIFDKLSHDPSTRVILLSGAGPRAFTAGLDVKAAASSSSILSASKASSTNDSNNNNNSNDNDGARIAAQLRRYIDEFQDCITAIERCEKPVIAVLHGISFGLAIDMTTAADVRLCAKDTRFSVKEVDIGLAADIGSLSRLPKVVGNLSWVKEVCLSARVFGAEEAFRVGFVSAVHESKDDAVLAGLKLAEVIAAKSPVAVQGTKELLNWSRDHSVQDGETLYIYIYCMRPILLLC